MHPAGLVEELGATGAGIGFVAEGEVALFSPPGCRCRHPRKDFSFFSFPQKILLLFVAQRKHFSTEMVILPSKKRERARGEPQLLAAPLAALSSAAQPAALYWPVNKHFVGIQTVYILMIFDV